MINPLVLHYLILFIYIYFIFIDFSVMFILFICTSFVMLLFWTFFNCIKNFLTY